jgi:hypothetical protein
MSRISHGTLLASPPRYETKKIPIIQERERLVKTLNHCPLGLRSEINLKKKGPKLKNSKSK